MWEGNVGMRTKCSRVVVVLAVAGFVVYHGFGQAFGFPWAKIHDTPDRVIPLHVARADYEKAIGKHLITNEMSPWEKDVVATVTMFGHKERNEKVGCLFITNIDLTGKNYDILLTMFADDEATLSVYDTEAAWLSNSTPNHSFMVKGGAAWQAASYKVAPFVLARGRKHFLALDYYNDMHWNDNRIEGKEDIDGVSVYLVRFGPDLAVDSDNNDGLNPPRRSHYEDEIEDDADKPGKYIRVNGGDVDNDGVPNFADGFDKWGNAGANAGGAFTPMILDLPEPMDMAKLRIRFSYSDSDPDGTQRTGAGTTVDPYVYEPAPGHLRVWTVDGTSDRRVAAVNGGGHYVKPGVVYTASQLGSGRTITLHVEGISSSATRGDQRIVVEVNPEGDDPAGFCTADAVRVTVVNVDLDIDSNDDNFLIDPDRTKIEEALEDRPGHAGKPLFINHLDRDKDGIPDYADGFDIDFGGGSQAAANASHDFVPILLEFSESIDIDIATVIFRGDFISDPAMDVTHVSSGGTNTYEIVGSGKVRLWCGKNGSDARKKASVTAMGNSIIKDEAIRLSMLSPSNRVVRLYLEALKRSNGLGDIERGLCLHGSDQSNGV